MISSLLSNNNTNTNDSNTKRERSRPTQDGEETAPGNCSFCLQVPAALSVQFPVRKKRVSHVYCLPCYYTTSAVRQDKKYVSIVDQEQLDEQLPPMQQLFSEAYIELQKELSDESEKAFQKQKTDPLAVLLHAPTKRRSTKPPPKKKNAGNTADGGFLRDVPLPERLLRTQQQQARLQQAQIARMNQAASATANVYQRRKPSRKSIWNLAMDPNTKGLPATSISVLTQGDEHAPACSCGSQNVRSFGNITSRNQDLKKGETWGMKDRGEDVMGRYQCSDCGKTWTEEA